MKVSLFIFFISSVASESFIKGCGNKVGPIDNQMEVFNSRREKFMKSAGISNMFELKYDPSLEEEIRKMKSCEDVKNGANFRVNNISNADSSFAIRKLLTISEGMYVFENEVIDREILHPTQHFVAYCVILESCKGHYPNYYYNADNPSLMYHHIDLITILGPRSTYSESDFKLGKVGSNCPNGATPKGLCKGPEVKPPNSAAVLNIFLGFLIVIIA